MKKGGFWGEKGGFWGADLDEIGVFGIADGDDGVDLLDELLLLVVVELHVPLGQAGLPSAVLDEDEANLPPPPDPKMWCFWGGRTQRKGVLPPICHSLSLQGFGGVLGVPYFLTL